MEELDEVFNTVAVVSSSAISVASVEAYFDKKLHDLQMHDDPCDMFSMQHRQTELERQLLLQMFTEIMQLPRVEIQPVPTEATAHWLDKTDWTGIFGYKQCQCSSCEFVKSGRGTAYCERCGAKMTVYAERKE